MPLRCDFGSMQSGKNGLDRGAALRTPGPRGRVRLGRRGVLPRTHPRRKHPILPRFARAGRESSTRHRRLVAYPMRLKFANGLLRQKKYDLAAEEFERFANSGAKGSDLDDARFGLANARLYQGNFRESRQAFDEFLKGRTEDPRRLTARYRLGELAYLLGDLAAARRSLEEFTAATSDHPGLEMALTYLGDTCFGLQDFLARTTGLRAVARGVSARDGSPNGRNMGWGALWRHSGNGTRRSP